MRKEFIFILCVLINSSAMSMSPPVTAVQISPGFPVQGLGTVTAPGLGVSFSVIHSRRDELQRGSQGVSNPRGEKTETIQSNLLFDYAFGDRLTGLLSVPIIKNEASFNDPNSGGTVVQKVEGMGDIAVFGRYSIWKNYLVAPTREWSGILGVEFATGSTSEKDGDGNRLAATQQPGSGATDFIVGTSLVWAFSRFSFFGDSTYKIHGKRSYVFGDVLSVNAGVSIPFAKDRFGLLAELNSEFAGQDQSSFFGAPGRNPDGSVQNTGRRIIYGSPSLQWRWGLYSSLTAGIQIPLYQHFRGIQLKENLNYRLGVSTRFGS